MGKFWLKKREEYFDEDLEYSQADVVVGYYYLLFKEGIISSAELVAKLMDEDDNACDAKVARDGKVIQLIKKIFNKVYDSKDVKELLYFLYPLSELALGQQKRLKEYLV